MKKTKLEYTGNITNDFIEKSKQIALKEGDLLCTSIVDLFDQNGKPQERKLYVTITSTENSALSHYDCNFTAHKDKKTIRQTVSAMRDNEIVELSVSCTFSLCDEEDIPYLVTSKDNNMSILLDYNDYIDSLAFNRVNKV